MSELPKWMPSKFNTTAMTVLMEGSGMKIDKDWTNVVPTKASRVGGTRKVRDLDADETCTDPGHKPPGMMVYEDGHYEHTCQSCGHVTRFVVRKSRL